MSGTDLRVRLADGTDVGYVDVGDPEGAAVLHLHGTPSSRIEAAAPALRRAAESLGIRLLAPDRPGIGLTPFRRFSIAAYPRLLGAFADALELERFAVTAFSGGGKYACACAWCLADRVSRVVLASSTCPFDAPGAKATWSKEDRQGYVLADRAPWLLRLYFAKLRSGIRRDPTAVLSLFPELAPADRELLASDDFRHTLRRVLTEAFRQGTRGPARDFTLEARPWGVPLDEIRVPVELWHGEDDRVVAAEQSRILGRLLPLAVSHFVGGEGHFSLLASHAEELLRSAVEP